MSTQLLLPMFVAPKTCGCGSALAEHVISPRDLDASCILRCPRVCNAEGEAREPKRVQLGAWLERIYGPTLGRIS